jgi:exopolysaccharide biosynthesis polyprenyl glycosylphosphotransferase
MGEIRQSQECEVRTIQAEDEKVFYEFLKRIIDILLSVISLIALSPVFVIIAIAIKLDSSGPIVYSQTRVGKNGKHFKMFKFRSMIINAEEMITELKSMNEMDGPMFKIKKDPRITMVGRFIRRTSIDELPQLINILRGEMSIVGPRPSLPSEVKEFEPWMMERFVVKPGLTCFWQVSGRNNIPFHKWMELDIKYVKERNLWLDVKLVFKTIKVVIKGDDAS